MARANKQNLSPHPAIRLNEYNLLIVDRNEKEVGYKIAFDYFDAKVRIKLALATGKVILFLPGTYDLLHAGHIVWFDQAISRFRRHLGLSRKDICVVVPFDNDKLTRIKKFKIHVSQGGPEVYLRPIINESTRAVALANLPYTDLIMPIPSPFDLDKLLPRSKRFDVNRAQILLSTKRLKRKIGNRNYLKMKKVLNTYKNMESTKDFSDVKEAFVSEGLLPSESKSIYENTGIDDGIWSDASWQLMCFLFKMGHELFEKQNTKKQSVFRVISEHDGYTTQVKFVMHLTGIEALAIKEDYITSTTRIIEKNNSKTRLDRLIASTDPRNYRFS
jgi:hypothetical protein